MAVMKNEKDKVEVEFSSIFYLEAPVDENQIIGNMKVLINRKTIDVLNIRNKEKIAKKGMMDYLMQMLEIMAKVEFYKL